MDPQIDNMQDIRDNVPELIRETGWSNESQSDSAGPVELVHQDESEITVVDAVSTTSIRLDYDPSKGNRAFKDSPIRDSAENIFAWLEHISVKHDTESTM